MQTLGITGLSNSQVSVMAKELGEHVEQFRTRRLQDAGPLTFVAGDALVLKVRKGGRVVPVHAMVATYWGAPPACGGQCGRASRDPRGAGQQQRKPRRLVGLNTPGGWVKALLHSIYDQPDPEAAHAQFDRVVEALPGNLPEVADHLETARADIFAFTPFPRRDLATDLVEQPQRTPEP